LIEAVRCDSHDISLLSFAAPDLKRAQAPVSVVDFSKLKASTESGISNKLGKSVGQAASANVVDKLDGVVLAKGCASVDDLLSTSLDLSVATLHTGKVKVDAALTRLDTGSGTTSKTDEHSRATKNDQVSASADEALGLESVLGTDSSDTTSKHDRLVVATQLGFGLRNRKVGSQGTEVTSCARATELVVESSATDRSLEHDVESARQVSWLANVQFPGLDVVRNEQVRDGVTGQTSLWLGTSANGALVTDLSTGSSGGSRVR
jgi:hypothetical protein